MEAQPLATRQKKFLNETKKNFKKVLTTKKILCYNGGVAVGKQVKKTF